MITDARVLQLEFVPNDVTHRAGRIDHLSSTLEPLTYGDPADSAVISGPPGTGKSCIAQYTLDKLRENVVDIKTESRE